MSTGGHPDARPGSTCRPRSQRGLANPGFAGAAAAGPTRARRGRRRASPGWPRSRRARRFALERSRRRCRSRCRAATPSRAPAPRPREPTRASPCRPRRAGSDPRHGRQRRASRTAARRFSLRPTRMTRAPRPARASVAARPRPDVGPVMRTVRRSSAPAGGAGQRNRRRRTAMPTRLKLPTIDSSRAPSTTADVSSGGARSDRRSIDGNSSSGSRWVGAPSGSASLYTLCPR